MRIFPSIRLLLGSVAERTCESIVRPSEYIFLASYSSAFCFIYPKIQMRPETMCKYWKQYTFVLLFAFSVFCASHSLLSTRHQAVGENPEEQNKK